MLYRLQFLVAILSFSFTSQDFGQGYFNYTSNTGNNATIAIPVTSNPNIDGNPLQQGDEIGVFTPAGLCVGAVVWNNVNTSITVWGDNPQTPEIDGILPGEEMKFRLWQSSNNIEYDSVQVTYSMGNGMYSVNGIFVLASLAGFSSNASDLNPDYYPDNFIISSKVYPNPFNSSTKLLIESKLTAPVNIMLFNVNGKELMRMNNVLIYQGRNEINFLMNGFPSGVYLITTRLTENNFSNKDKSLQQEFLINKIVLLK